MSRIWEFIVAAILTIALPVYAWLLASILLIIAVALGAIIVPLGLYYAERAEEKEARQSPTTIEDQREPRKAA